MSEFRIRNSKRMVYYFKVINTFIYIYEMNWKKIEIIEYWAYLINRFVPLAPWVKVYLVSGKKCLAKAKTSQENSPTTSSDIGDDYINIHIEMKYNKTLQNKRDKPAQRGIV